nr:HAD hydrolase family protein [Antribacter gilvus]
MQQPTEEAALAGPVTRTAQIVALDIGGTLVGRDGIVPDATREAVTDVLARGIEVVLATGCSLVGVVPVSQQLGLTSGWLVASNGAVTGRSRAAVVLPVSRLAAAAGAPRAMRLLRTRDRLVPLSADGGRRPLSHPWIVLTSTRRYSAMSVWRRPTALRSSLNTNAATTPTSPCGAAPYIGVSVDRAATRRPLSIDRACTPKRVPPVSPTPGRIPRGLRPSRRDAGGTPLVPPPATRGGARWVSITDFTQHPGLSTPSGATVSSWSP